MSRLITGSEEVVPESIWDRMGQFYTWYNAQPSSPLSVDMTQVLAVLPIRPTMLEDWARRQDWSS